jgi:hypothetical protein
MVQDLPVTKNINDGFSVEKLPVTEHKMIFLFML